MENRYISGVDPYEGGEGLWQQINKKKILTYPTYKGITRMHLFLALGYICKTLIPGSYFVCETEEDVHESIEHFKFLRKYKLI